MCTRAYAGWKVAYADYISKNVYASAYAIFLTGHGEASGFQPTQSCLRQKVNKCIREERALPRLHCKTHMISLRNISCSSLLSMISQKKRCSIGSYIPTAAACSVSSLCICIAATFAAHGADFAKILARLAMEVSIVMGVPEEKNGGLQRKSQTTFMIWG